MKRKRLKHPIHQHIFHLSFTPVDAGSDKEKAALIMQVMNLTPEQINMLPLEQRRSILELRAQLANQR